MFVKIFLRINFVTYKECLYKECHGTKPTVENIFNKKYLPKSILCALFLHFRSRFEMRIRILSKLRILTDPHPQHCYPVRYLGSLASSQCTPELLRLLIFIRLDTGLHSRGPETLAITREKRKYDNSSEDIEPAQQIGMSFSTWILKHRNYDNSSVDTASTEPHQTRRYFSTRLLNHRSYESSAVWTA